MASILIVDDDKNFLLSVADGLRTHTRDFDVLTAENGLEAIKILDSQKVDLLVTDVKMPEMDGLELLAHMVSNHPNVPVIIMTAFATREMEDQATNMGTFKFLEKPLDFHMLLEKINEGMDVGAHYFTKVISLISFLQTVEREGKTCTIAVRSKEEIGYLYFFNGMLIDGETPDTRGAQAVYNIVSWEDAEVEIDCSPTKGAKKIDKPLNFIIKEEMHRRTHMAETQKKIPPEKSGKSDSSEKTDLNPKEGKMNQKKMREAIDILIKDMDDALLSTGIVSRLDGRIVLEENIHPKTGVFFKQLTAFIPRMLSECNMPPMGKYYLIDLEDEKSLIAIPHMNYIWGITLDLKKVAMGLFLNVTLPKILKAFDEAISIKESG